MIRSNRGLLAIAVLTLIAGLIAQFPARVALDWFAPPELGVNGIRGTVWRGRASEASIDGLYFRDIEWRMHVLSLFTGDVSYRVKATPLSGFFDSDIHAGFDGAVALTDLTAALPLELFAAAAGVAGMRGQASFAFERVEIIDGLAVIADGSMQVDGLLVPDVAPESLGAYSAEFFTQNNGISASIEDTDGVLDLAGSLLVKHDRSFEFIAQVIVTQKTPNSIRRQLSKLPPADERGRQEIRLEGVL